MPFNKIIHTITQRMSTPLSEGFIASYRIFLSAMTYERRLVPTKSVGQLVIAC